MKKTKGIRLFLGLVLTIVLNVACFPIGVLAENEAEQGTLIPLIVFSSDPVYNGNPHVLATVNPAVDGPGLNPDLIEITYKGIQANGEAYPLSAIPPSAAGTYMVFAGYRGDEAYQSIDDKKEIKIMPVELKTTEFFTEKPIAKIYDGNTSVPENAFASEDPLRVIPSCIVGSALAGGLSMFFGCTLMAPHGGIFVFPLVGSPFGYVIALLAGSVASMLMLSILKKPKTSESDELEII